MLFFVVTLCLVLLEVKRLVEKAGCFHQSRDWLGRCLGTHIY